MSDFWETYLATWIAFGPVTLGAYLVARHLVKGGHSTANRNRRTALPAERGER